MDVIITPTKLNGRVTVPPSKSVAHRAIVCASLAQGKSVISNVAMSDDIKATVGCMRLLGAEIEQKDGLLEIVGIKGKSSSDITFDCNESGSTLRFILPIALALNDGVNSFVGKGKLGERPMKIYSDICKEQGIEYVDKSLQNQLHKLDIKVKGKLNGGKFVVDGGVSSQFVTGLLFALPLLEGDSEIIISGELQSRGYIDLTLSALKTFGIDIANDAYNRFYIKGGQKYKAKNYFIEGDYSQSAFYETANYIGNEVVQNGLDAESLQGDKVIIDFIGRLKNATNDEALTFDGGNCPDIIPVFALACCMRRGRTRIVNISRLRIKECDRLFATAQELSKMGADIRAEEDSLIIDGVTKLRGASVDSHNDHRMAMTLAIASTVADGEVKISNAQSVSKSYPDFFEVFESLGGKLKYINRRTQ